MNRLKLFLVSVAMVLCVSMGAALLGVGTSHVSAAPATTATSCSPSVGIGCSACSGSFLGLIPWYYFLNLNPTTCDVDFHLLANNGKDPSSVPLILLAVLDDLVRVAGLVAVGFVIYGGVKYITSQGSPDQTKQAQQTVINALIGLAIAVVATGFVAFIGRQLAGSTAAGVANSTGGLNGAPLPHVAATQDTLTRLLNIFFKILGGIALIIVTIGGLRYIFADGNPQSITQAKNTIIYALIGLVIAVTGYAIVNFVLVGLRSAA